LVAQRVAGESQKINKFVWLAKNLNFMGNKPWPGGGLFLGRTPEAVHSQPVALAAKAEINATQPSFISLFLGGKRRFWASKRKGCVYTDVSGHCKATPKLTNRYKTLMTN
jgi:hypothetical protein